MKTNTRLIELWVSASSDLSYLGDRSVQFNLLAVKPTHLAYGMTSRSQLLDANRMMAVVMQMQPTKMHINASNHSGCNSGVKHWYGRLYNVMHVHIRPNRVSPVPNENKNKRENCLTEHFSSNCRGNSDGRSLYLRHRSQSNRV